MCQSKGIDCLREMDTFLGNQGFQGRSQWKSAILAGSLGKPLVSYMDHDMCRSCFANYIGCHLKTIYRRQKELKQNKVYVIHGNVGTSKIRDKSLRAGAWAKSYARRSGDYLPHKQLIQLPEYKWADVHRVYILDMSTLETQTGLPHDTVGEHTLRDVCARLAMNLTTRKCFKTCKVCDKLKSERKTKKTDVEKIAINEILQKHNILQMAQRAKYAHHQEKAARRPVLYLSLSLDDIDHDKPSFPVVSRATSDMQKLNKWTLHVSGAKVHGPNGFVKAFTWYNEFPHDVSVLIECILRVLEEVQNRNDGQLPETLYLQLDNAKSNKCNNLLVFLTLLVELGVFKKIKLCFLLVGHTHNDVDQFFSLFERLSKNKGLELFTLPQMHEFISSLHQKGGESSPVLVEHIDRVLDYKTWLASMKAKPVKNISQPLLFRIKKEDRQEGRTLVHVRKYMSTSKKEEPDCYEPDQGIHLLGPERLQRLPLLASAVTKIPLDHEHASRSKSTPLEFSSRSSWQYSVDEVCCFLVTSIQAGIFSVFDALYFGQEHKFHLEVRSKTI